MLSASIAAGSASIMFGASVVATRFVIHEIDPLLLSFIRYLIATLCLAPIIIVTVRERPGRRDVAPIAILGVIFFGLFPWLFSAGLQYIPASRGALWIATMPFLTFGLAAVLRVEAITMPKIVGLMLATAGAVIVLLQGTPRGVTTEQAWLGDLLFFATACCGAIYFVFSRPILKRLPALLVTCLTMAAGTIFLGLMSAVRGTLQVPQLQLAEWLIIGFLGFFGAALGFFLWIWALKHSTPTRTAIFATLNPMAATFLGATLLGEALTGAFLAGLALVFAGIIAANVPLQRTPTSQTT